MGLAKVPIATISVSQLRDTLGISQAELAKLAGVSRHTVMRAENGRTVPSPLVQAALARVAEDHLKPTRAAVNLPMVNLRRMDLLLLLRRLSTIDPRGNPFKEETNAQSKEKGNAKRNDRRRSLEAKYEDKRNF